MYDISDHLPIFSVISAQKNRMFFRKISNETHGNFKLSNSIDERELELGRLNFDSSIDINTQLNQLIKTFSKVVNKNASLRPTTRREKQIKMKPWLTKDVLKSIKVKNSMYKRLIFEKDLLAYGSKKIY